jgi:ATPase subunit of ABC transporter with duplicated ATPase domains
MSPRARQAKGKARLAAYEEMASKEVVVRDETSDIVIPPGTALGEDRRRRENVRKGYGDNVLMEDLNMRLPRGGIVGVIGPTARARRPSSG